MDASGDTLASDTFSIDILATDLDGTLIPLDDDSSNRRDLQRLRDEHESGRLILCFVTGRHLESVLQVAKSQSLPTPDWMICDVGTSIYAASQTKENSATLTLVPSYADHLAEIVGSWSTAQLADALSGVAGLRLQESEKQGTFKLSYYCDAESLNQIVDEVAANVRRNDAPYQWIASVDPFNGDGLIDLLPAGVSKAKALDWWSAHCGYDPDKIMFAGDSGNDLAAMCGGFRTIMVANTAAEVVRQAAEFHQARGWTNRLFHATEKATSGVWQGLVHYRNDGPTDQRT